MSKYGLIAGFLGALLLAACGSSGTSQTPGSPPTGPSPSPANLGVSPAALTLNTFDQYFPTPVPVEITGPAGFGSKGLTITSTRPDLVGAWVSELLPGASSATIDVVPTGSTDSTFNVTVTDGFGGSGMFSVTTNPPCGRPDAIDYTAMLSPKPGSSRVSIATSTVYLAVGVSIGVHVGASPAPPGQLHFVVNGQTPVQGAAMSYATPPAGSATPSPPPNTNLYYGAGALPALASGTSYDVYVYDDACEGPWKAGTFST